MNIPYKRLPLVFLLAAFLNPLAASGQAEQLNLPTRPHAYVMDLAGVVSPAEEQKLNAYLSELETKTGAQMVVLVLPSLEGRSIEEFSIEMAHDRWGLGQKGKDNGLLITVAVADRKYRIEVGYGLEGILPDSLVGSMGRDYLVPFFRQGDYAGGITAVVSAMAPLIATQAGVTLEASPPAVEHPSRSPARKPSLLSSLFSVVVVIIVMLCIIRNPGLVLAFLVGSTMGGRRRSGFGNGPFAGGGGGFGGGFGGGGGGGFGGGGASGSW